MPTDREEVFKSDLPSRAISVWQYLKYRANKENSCFPSIRTISTDLSISRSTAKRALNDLVAAGFLRKEPRTRPYGSKTSNLYHLI